LCFLSCLLSCSPLVLHSFPTRRSSDLAFLLIGGTGRRCGRRQVSATDASAVRKSRPRLVSLPAAERVLLLAVQQPHPAGQPAHRDRKSTRLNSSHVAISYAVFCLKKKK